MRLGSDVGDDMDVARRAARLTEANALVHATFVGRDSSPEAFKEWESSTRAAHRAYAEMYPPEFTDLLLAVQAGSETAIEPVLAFLEADPWCFRSGYVKERIAHLLRRHELSPPQRGRLEQVLVHLVDVGDRREFSEYCKLARQNPTPWLRRELRLRVSANDESICRRALVMLTSLRHPRLDAEEVAVARALIVREARRDGETGLAGGKWARKLAIQLSDDDWAGRLATIGLAEGEASLAALRVLGWLRGVQLSDEQRQAASQMVLAVIDLGGDESWFEEIARLADSAPFRDALMARSESRDSEVARRAYWAGKAVRLER